MRAVYSPCVETLEYMFGGKKKKLPPKELVVLEDGEARHLVTKFGKFGVRFLATVKKGNKLEAAPDAFREAGEAWEKGNRAWAEETVTDFSESTKAQREAGVKVEEPTRVQVAKKVLKIAVVILALLLPAASWAQDGQHASANFNYKYDVASATITYCTMDGIQGNPFGAAIDGVGTVETSGASVTVTGVDLTQDVFAAVNIGDLFQVRLSNGTTETRVVVTNADADTITVDSTITLPGNVWTYKVINCGTTVDDGWISTAGYSNVQMTFQYDVGDLTNAAVTMECKSGGLEAAPVRVYPGVGSDCGDGTLNGAVCEFPTPGQRIAYKIANNGFAACRVGVAFVTADGGTRDELNVTLDVGR